MRQNKRWTPAEESIMYSFISEHDIVSMEDFNTLHTVLLPRTPGSVYMKLRKTIAQVRPSVKIDHVISQTVTKEWPSSKRIYKYGKNKVAIKHQPKKATGNGIVGAILKTLETYYSEHYNNDSEVQSLKRENEELKAMLRKLRALREAAEKFKFEFTNSTV